VQNADEGSFRADCGTETPVIIIAMGGISHKHSQPTDSVQFALTETRSSILDTIEPIPELVHQRIIAQDALVTKGSEIVANRLVQTPR